MVRLLESCSVTAAEYGRTSRKQADSPESFKYGVEDPYAALRTANAQSLDPAESECIGRFVVIT